MLFGASQAIERPLFMGSNLIDLAIRIILCIWFCYGYIQLPFLSRGYAFLPRTSWSKADVLLEERIFIIVQIVIFSLLMAVVTWWIIQFFVPALEEHSVIIAILNGFLYLVPLLAQYEKYKM
jgi:hypothetical protein